MLAIGTWGYGLNAVLYAILILALLIKWRKRMQGTLLLPMLLVVAAWSGLSAYLADEHELYSLFLITSDIFRQLFITLFLLRYLNAMVINADQPLPLFNVLTRATYIVAMIVVAIIAISLVSNAPLPAWLGYSARLLAQIGLTLLGLALLEQIYRYAPADHRWTVKFLCIALGAVLLYDFYLYSDALLFNHIDPQAWDARGFINIFSVPLLALSISRSPEKIGTVFLSRHFVFYTATLVIAGAYLMIMATGGYYLRVFGGDWGVVARNTFLMVGGMALVIILSSGQLRSRLRVYIDKHFLEYKYDYRDEWLRLIRQLSTDDGQAPPERRAINALADIVDSVGGYLWIRKNEHFYAAYTQNMPALQTQHEPAHSALAAFLEQWQWVINLDEYRAAKDLYQGLKLPEWLTSAQSAWLVIPLMLQTKLYGFVVLAKPRAPREFNWEDIDLLKTAGRQVAIHLAQSQSAEALAETRQFAAFSRFSAYVMHDLKNLIAQLDLITANAKKHIHNPAFVQDAMSTVENAVGRMKRLLAQLRGGQQEGVLESIDVAQLLERKLKDAMLRKPQPVFENHAGEISVKANSDKLSTVIGHIVQNAQEATSEDGKVTVRLTRVNERCLIEIEDNGSGMDEQFIKEKLFAPFESTKGLTGMGIGVYEAKEYIESLGGQLEVASRPGAGTLFTIRLLAVSE